MSRVGMWGGLSGTLRLYRRGREWGEWCRRPAAGGQLLPGGGAALHAGAETQPPGVGVGQTVLLHMKVSFVLTAFIALTSCTYAEPVSILKLDYAISDNESMAAIVAERSAVHRPTGFAAFPDGGLPRITRQFVDVYVISPESRQILYKHTIDPPGERSLVALSTWLPGWKDNDVYVTLSGCESSFHTWRTGCNGERRKTYTYRVSGADVEQVDSPAPSLVRHRRFGGEPGPDSPVGARSYISTRDGVWIVRGADGEREALLVINGYKLEQARVQ